MPTQTLISDVVIPLCLILGSLLLCGGLLRLFRIYYYYRQDRKWSVDNIDFDDVEQAETITIEQPMKDSAKSDTHAYQLNDEELKDHTRLEIAV